MDIDINVRDLIAIEIQLQNPEFLTIPIEIPVLSQVSINIILSGENINMQSLEMPITNVPPVVAGSTPILEFTCLQSSGSLFENLVAGTSKVTFEMKKYSAGGTIFSKKSLAAGGSDSEISIDSTSKFSVKLLSADTAGLVPFTYFGKITIEVSPTIKHIVYLNTPII